jgi:hypothetical protein
LPVHRSLVRPSVVLRDGVNTDLVQTLTPPHQNSRFKPRCPPSCCGRRAAVWSWACSSRPISGFGEAATTRKQPANLAVEGAEETLSILPDYTPTVRPLTVRPTSSVEYSQDEALPTPPHATPVDTRTGLRRAAASPRARTTHARCLEYSPFRGQTLGAGSSLWLAMHDDE